ncbi:MAG: Periplasmic dipeptide transport protein precursor, partial [Pseudomonadota bacterium]
MLDSFVNFLSRHPIARAHLGIRTATVAVMLGVATTSFAATPANPNKVLRLAFPTQETGFDPARVGDLYSNTVISAIMTPLVRYDWMANPARVVPNVISAMPELSKDRREYTFRIKPGFFYAPDPAFKGQKRELRAEDFVYGFKRHADPRSRSPQFADMADRIVGFRKA